jgi:ankyrin repeat protein
VNGHEAVVDALLALPKDKSINMDAKDQHGQTALSMAAGRGRVAIVRKLLDLGADWSVVDGEGQRAVDRAAEGGYTQCCELLQVGGWVSGMLSL